MDMIGHVLLGLAAILGAVFLAVLTKLLSDEAKAWMPSLAERLLSIAIRTAPATRRERLTEEWHSHLQDIPGELGRLAFGLNLLLAARRIAREFPDGARSEERHLDPLVRKRLAIRLLVAEAASSILGEPAQLGRDREATLDRICDRILESTPGAYLDDFLASIKDECSSKRDEEL